MDQVKNAFSAVSFDEFETTSYDEWKEAAVETLKGGDFKKRLVTKTYEGIELNPIYIKEDVEALGVSGAFPGTQNFLRGVSPAGYMGETWDIAQTVDAQSPAEANAMLLDGISRGATAINCKIGAGGLDVKTAEDMKTLLKGIDLNKTKLHIVCGESADAAVKLISGLAGACGCVGADPIGTMAGTGGLSRNLDALYDDMAAAVKFAAEKTPNLRTVLVDGNVYANGGASAVQEVSLCMSTAAAYLDAMLSRGINADTAAKAIRFSFSLGSNFFMEIAKLRAARVVWAQIAEEFGAGEDARKISVFARTSAFTKTIYDPYVNILRATTEAFAGVVGGVDAMEVAPLDEAYGGSDETTRRIARNVQIMLQEEFGLTLPVDPAGGSYYVEALTAEMANSVWAGFQKLDAQGGIAVALKAGTVQTEIDGVLQSRFKNLATRSDRAVGTNMYANVLETRLERSVSKAAAASPVSAETVQPILPRRWTEQYEELRAATENYQAKTGKAVKVFLANMGPVSQHKARADFSCGFFEVGRFEMLRNDGFATVEEASAAAIASGADITVICSTDDTYPELVPPLASSIKAVRPDMIVILAGAPDPEMKDSYTQAGVEEFIHVRANCYEILRGIQSKRGIR